MITQRPKRRFIDVIAIPILYYLGIEATIGRWVEFHAGPYSLALVLAAFLALAGWQRGGLLVAIPRYHAWAGLLGAWLLISAVASWRMTTVNDSWKIALWFVFVIPGLAAVLREQRLRYSLILGLAAGAAVYVVGAVYRWVLHRPVLDPGGTAGFGSLMGVNRNAVNIVILFVLPFVLAGVGPRLLRIVRWPLLAGSVFLMVNSGGRTALVGMVIVGLVYVLLQGDLTRRVRTFAAGALVASILIVAVQSTGGSALVGANRLFDLLHGETSTSDTTRHLLLQKSWQLGEEHPAFGVGYNNFIGAPATVLLTATNEYAFVQSIVNDEHNTFAQFLAETGFPGLVFFIGVLLAAALYAWRVRRRHEVRALLAASAGIAVSIAFHNAVSTAIYIPLTLLLACYLGSIGPVQHTNAEHEPIDARVVVDVTH